MKPMKLAEVRKQTGRNLIYAEAAKLANPGDPFLRNLALALCQTHQGRQMPFRLKTTSTSG